MSDPLSDERPRVGVSSCLTGERVRFDGGHKETAFVVGELAARVELVRVCPEVELGLGTPRPPVELVRDGARSRMVMVESRRDLTDAMEAFAVRRAEELATLGLDGYVWKSASPSCGLTNVKIIDKRGEVRREARGLFAAAVRARLPTLPMLEEIDLADAVCADEFLERVEVAWRLRRGRR